MARSQQPLSGKEAAKNSESREKIIRAAFKEFGEHGYEGASTNQICLAAGISKGLLYHYFGSKEKLFLSVCDCCIRDIEEELIGLMEGRTAVDLNALSIFYRKQAAVGRGKLRAYRCPDNGDVHRHGDSGYSGGNLRRLSGAENPPEL